MAEIVVEVDELAHYGTPRHSGRYKWGSGKTPMERGRRTFLDQVTTLKRQGLSEAKIAEGLGLGSTTELRAKVSIARDEHRASQATQALRLNESGMNNSAIARQMGLNESSVRALLTPANAAKRDVLQSTASFLKDQVDSGGYLDIGSGTENWRGISGTKLNTAVAILKEQGYVVHKVQTPNVGAGGGKKTTVKVLAPPGTTYVDVKTHPELIKSIAVNSQDGGRTIEMAKSPVPVDPKRVAVRWADEGGSNADGVIYIRPGVSDISLGGKAYAQVRIQVGDGHYLKGMAMYSDKLPAGTDILFNTNKPKSSNKLDAMKPVGEDPINPFGSSIKPQRTWTDASGKTHQSPINIVNEAGDWTDWSKSLSSQVLSKQSPALARRQLDEAFRAKQDELDGIMQLTNPVIRHKLLMTFGDSSDAAAVHLKAAALPGQRTHVILPIEGMRPDQVFAPTHHDGDKVVLIRHPHGGTFEIPELTVNNRNVLARKTIGSGSLDAIGIHPDVAKRLSGADFDGDTVLVIPNKRGDIKTTKALADLDNFDPITHYGPYDGMRTVDGGIWRASTGKVDYGNGRPKGRPKQQKMGDVSNLITDMTIKGADRAEIARAVKHSMVVIDSEKHHLDVKRSYEDNGIAQLKAKYQGVGSTGRLRGASTIISRSGSETRVPERRARRASEDGPIDPVTGRKMFTPTGATSVDRRGRTIIKTRPSSRMAETTDARSLLSDNPSPMELIYASHANSMKDLANKARLASLGTGRLTYSPSAAKTYAHQVASLSAKLNVAQKNAPLERQAQLVANQIIAARLHDNPHVREDPDAYKKLRGQSLQMARARVGAKKELIDITAEEWHAIQSGAISTNRLNQIIENANIDKLKKLATPRTKAGLSGNQAALARARLAAGYTQAQVAQSLGISISTLSTALKGEGG